MPILEMLLLVPLLLVLVGSMMAYAYFSGTMRTQEAKVRKEKEHMIRDKRDL